MPRAMFTSTKMLLPTLTLTKGGQGDETNLFLPLPWWERARVRGQDKRRTELDHGTINRITKWINDLIER